MAILIQTVVELEEKLEKLVYQQKMLLDKLEELEMQKREWQVREREYEQEILSQQETIKNFQHANALLGSDQYSKETKRKINTLIREIDLCIAHLSED